MRVHTLIYRQECPDNDLAELSCMVIGVYMSDTLAMRAMRDHLVSNFDAQCRCDQVPADYVRQGKGFIVRNQYDDDVGSYCIREHILK